MTPDEVGSVLRYLAAAFPQREQTVETVAVWTTRIAALDFARAIEAAEQLVDTSEWHPTVAGFMAAYRAAGPSLHPPALPPAPVVEESSVSVAKRWRALMQPDLDAIGRGGRKGVPLHNGRRADDCDECQRRAREVGR